MFPVTLVARFLDLLALLLVFEIVARGAVRSFDVEENHRFGCAYDFIKHDFLKVDGVKYCGHGQGPHGVTPTAGSELIWHTDYSVTGAGIKICAAD